ncbi:Crp/Fnr family transcriptional regulator [Paracoccus contaminans]|uniref:HTH crp-type domain-containing protein n=1 Tax=Paracoccus contaminans TaxID=1945662 RepID=A0A1W6CW43_9RHOB|nr:Crp/Fnr family transcriptional regulator [Paracoccus contaminans]ARJ69092.1 hypothetical protein B0A89_05085 [Paracoccus contaminans]
MSAGISLDQSYPNLFTPEDQVFVRALEDDPVSIPPRHALTLRGEPLSHAAYLTSGFAGRFRADWTGRRQLLSLHIPGDFIDLPSFMLFRLDHDIDSFNAITCARLHHDRIAQMRVTMPHLYDCFWRISLMDSAIQRYWAFRVGRLVGRARIANFFAEIFARMFARKLCGTDGFTLPLTQADIGEACGMTPVHANRMLGELREEGTCTLENGRLVIHDLRLLASVGQFEWDYLYLPPQAEAELADLLGAGATRQRRRAPAPAPRT